jgi:hypothetical protein
VCTRLAAASDNAYQLLTHGRWFYSGTPASSTTKTGRHDIAELMLKVTLNTINHQINQFSFPTKIMIKDEIFARTNTYIYGYTGGYQLELRRIVTTGSATSGTGIDHISAASQFITVHFVQSLDFSWVMFCQSMFVFLSFFF